MRETSVRRSRRAPAAVAAAAAVLGLGAVFAPSAGAGGNPPGANGTVKIDGVEFDSHPNNEPHVGCSFQVDFYGFDEGAYNATVEFEVHPPTGNELVLTDTVFIGEDPAGGGTDLDAEETYDLSSQLAGFAAHPQQGHHVKLTVSAPGANGKIAKKHKVFWVEGCGGYPPPPPPCDPYSDPYCDITDGSQS